MSKAFNREKVLRELLQEVMGEHRDKDDANYNECEDAPCLWCEHAAEVLRTPSAGRDAEWTAKFWPLLDDYVRARKERDRVIPPSEIACAMVARIEVALLAHVLGAPAAVSEVIAWRYELAHSINKETGEYCDWYWHLTACPPSVPEGSIRNLTPLIAGVLLPLPDPARRI